MDSCGIIMKLSDTNNLEKLRLEHFCLHDVVVGKRLESCHDPALRNNQADERWTFLSLMEGFICYTSAISTLMITWPTKKCAGLRVI